MSESKQCPKCESQLPQKLSSSTIICRQCGWSGRMKSNSLEISDKGKKSNFFLNLSVWKVIENFFKTRNGERILLVTCTFIFFSICLFIFSYFKSQNNSLSSSSTVTKEQEAKTNDVNSSSARSAISQNVNSYSLKGNLSIRMFDGVPLDCYGVNGYGDIKGEIPVTIKDGAGKIIAIGKTDVGYWKINDGTGKTVAVGDAVRNYTVRDTPSDFKATCNFEFTVNNVPKSDFYSISVGHRGELNYPFDEMEKQNWIISLSLD
jgi:hypothetical protein